MSELLRHKNSPGFTLMELMIVLAIVAVLMVVGGPSVVGVLNNNEQVGAVNTLVSGISSTRTYALTHKRPFVLEAIDGDWSNGFHIKPGSIAEPSVLDTKFESDTQMSIDTDLPGTFLSFDRLGRATPAASEFRVCNGHTGQAVVIDVNIFGNAVVRKDPDTGIFDYEGC